MEVNVVVAPVKSGHSSALKLESSKHVRKFNERPSAHVLVNYPEMAGSKKRAESGMQSPKFKLKHYDQGKKKRVHRVQFCDSPGI